jgi:hypothetical protein
VAKSVQVANVITSSFRTWSRGPKALIFGFLFLKQLDIEEMGGDGGSIPTRTDLVKIREKKKDTDPLVLVRIGWKYCAMSSQILNEPIVADELGNLYNKEAVLKYLMSKKPEPQFAHIRNLKVWGIFFWLH